MASFSRPAGAHRRSQRLRYSLMAAVVTAAVVASVGNVAVRMGGANEVSAFASQLPSVTLSSNAQSANRLALDAGGLRLGHDVVVPVQVTNAANKTLNVIADLASTNQGVQVAVSAMPKAVAPGSTVQYAVRLHATEPLTTNPSQVVVSFTPTS